MIWRLDDLDKIHKLSQKIEYYEEHQQVSKILVDAKGIVKGLMHGRQKYFEYRDKPGNMLASALAKNPERSTSEGLKKEDGTVTFQPSQKLDSLERYFEKVYSLEEHSFEDMERFVQEEYLPVTKPEHIDILEWENQEEEIKQVVSLLKTTKSPGPDRWLYFGILLKNRG